MKNIVVLSGAGISAESGIKTFRDADGLWEGHDVMEVATPEAWQRNPALVLDFYNQRRKQLFEVSPNDGHKALVRLEEKFSVNIITQNVDDLHERAGSRNIIHLHGELKKVRSTIDPLLIYDWDEDLILGQNCDKGSQLRPHIVWFGEAVPMIEPSREICRLADLLIIVGTSLQVYPAASLMAYAPANIPMYYVDPNPGTSFELSNMKNLTIIREKAGKGLTELVEQLLIN